MKRDPFITAYRKWKTASAPQHHLKFLIKSKLVDPSLKPLLRAEFHRLDALSEPLRKAANAVRNAV